jgi:hypothetical protein
MRRKQYNVLRWLVLRPVDWCDILGVRVIDPDGWRGSRAKPYEDPLPMREFVNRCFSSTMVFEEGATDYYDAENYVAEDEQAGE